MASFTSGFSVNIVADKVTDKKNNYGEVVHALADRSIFRIIIGNQTYNHCYAVVYLHGLRIGAFHIDPMSTTTIDRPVYSIRKFMFKKEKSYDFNKKNKDGIIEVHFLPDKLKTTYWNTPIEQCTCIDKKGCHKLSNAYSDVLLPVKSYNVESYIKKDNLNSSFATHKRVYMKKTDFTDKNVVLRLRLVNDTTRERPFISNTEKGVADIKKIPSVRQYEDFFLMNQFLPYR
jgi:hypothetical protein